MTSVALYHLVLFDVALSQGSFEHRQRAVRLFSAARKNLKQRLKLKPHFPSHFCTARFGGHGARREVSAEASIAIEYVGLDSLSHPSTDQKCFPKT